jgi:hypothetical protein
VRELFERARQRRVAIRLLGIALSNLRPEQQQLSLFDVHSPLHRAVDNARTRYGYEAVRIALASVCERDRER